MQASAEADTFFCFVELISGFKNNYCKHLDNSRVGIRSTLSKLSQLLKKHDEELWRHMEVITKVCHIRYLIMLASNTILLYSVAGKI
jgi:hypothetical protein